MRARLEAAASSTLEDENPLAKQIELLKTAFGRYNEKRLGGIYYPERRIFAIDISKFSRCLLSMI